MATEAPVSKATFERLFEVSVLHFAHTFIIVIYGEKFPLQAVRAINELLQTLSAIRARFNSDSSQLASYNIPTFVNNQ